MSGRSVPGGGFGNVGLGIGGAPSSHRPRPDLCASLNHPGATFNPWHDKTWCLCGEVVREGNHATHDDCCCGGRLIECLHDQPETHEERRRERPRRPPRDLPRHRRRCDLGRTRFADRKGLTWN